LRRGGAEGDAPRNAKPSATQRKGIIEVEVVMLNVKAMGIAVVGGLTMLMAAPVHANDHQIQQKMVSVSDLNLNSAEGQEKAQYRLAQAAKQVCPSAEVRDMALRAKAMKCREQAQSSAISALSRVTSAAQQTQLAARENGQAQP
jgi:UrcA family protein